MAKVNVYIPDDLLESVDVDALALGRSRSSIVQEALAQYVAVRSESERRSGVERAIDIADRVAATWPQHDASPEVSASDFLVGLRHASDGDSDADVVRRILEEGPGGRG
jgi:predicted transcriptional regulator